MGILDRITKKKADEIMPEKEEKKEKKPVEKKTAKKAASKKEKPKKKEEKKEKVKPVEGKSSLAYKVLQEPRITEKTTDLGEKDQYTFKVYSRTNKVEIKKAVEDLYGVDVLKVMIVNTPRKRRRLGRTQGFSPGYKKAIVKIKKGQKIEILPR